MTAVRTQTVTAGLFGLIPSPDGHDEKEQEVLLQSVICVYCLNPSGLIGWVRGGHVAVVCRTLPGSAAMACGDITGLLTA